MKKINDNVGITFRANLSQRTNEKTLTVDQNP